MKRGNRGAGLAVLVFRCCIQDTAFAAEIVMSATDAQLALGGLEWGMMPDQAKTEREQCLVVLRHVAGPMVRFMEMVVKACTADVAACVPKLSRGMDMLSRTGSGSHYHIDRVCPPQFSVLFTALRDPFLVVNMATLAFLHATALTQNVNLMLQAFSERHFEQFGFFMGRVLAAILPLVRLPLSERQMHQVIDGFVHAFEDVHHRHGRGHNVSALQGGFGKHGHLSDDHAKQAVHHARADSNISANVSGSTHHHDSLRRHPLQQLRQNQCLKATESQLAPANQALASIAGSLLNVSCYQEVAHQEACFERAVEGIISFASMLQNMMHTTKDLTHSDCPSKLIIALRRLDDKPHLALDFITNVVEDFGAVETHSYAAMDFFYENKLFLFGSQLGLLYNEITTPAFYKYKKVEIRFATYSASMRLLVLGLVPPMTFLLGALPLLCLFYSAVGGWPPQYDEVSVMPLAPGSEFAVTHEFFGGRMPIGSQVDFVVATTEDPELNGTFGFSSEMRKQVSSENSDEETGPWKHSKTMMTWKSDAWSGLGRETTTDASVSSKEPASGGVLSTSIPSSSHATHRLLLTLTEELEPMSWARYIFWTAVGFMIPCLAGGGRRWKHQVFRRSGTKWQAQPAGADRESIAAAAEYQPVPPSDVQEAPPLDYQAYLNYEIAPPPVPDRVTEIAFSVRRATSAVLRISPALLSKECWDQLLFASASVQLIASCWHLFYIMVSDTKSWLFEGEILTLMWHWSRGATAALAIHKKLHARWFRRLVNSEDKKNVKEIVCGCCRISRTPTPVRLTTSAPGVKSRVCPPLPWTYYKRYNVEVGDDVRVVRWSHPRNGCTGRVVQISFVCQRGEYTVDFGDAQISFSRSDLALADADKRSSRIPVWRDRLTPLLMRISLFLWLVTAVSLTAFGNAMCDDDGYIVLRIQAPSSREPLSDWFPGFVAFVQLLGITIELGARTFQWLLVACATALCYAAM